MVERDKGSEKEGIDNFPAVYVVYPCGPVGLVIPGIKSRTYQDQGGGG